MVHLFSSLSEYWEFQKPKIQFRVPKDVFRTLSNLYDDFFFWKKLVNVLTTLSPKPTKLPNTLKQFVDCWRRIV